MRGCKAFRTKARPAFLPVCLCEPYLRLMEQPGYDPFKTVIELPQWRRQWSLMARVRTLGLVPFQSYRKRSHPRTSILPNSGFLRHVWFFCKYQLGFIDAGLLEDSEPRHRVKLF